MTAPGLPATPGVPGVAAGVPVLVPGGVVWLAPGWVCVLDVPVCVPIPGLGVTVPVFCAAAMLTASANTDDANKILRINTAPFRVILLRPDSRTGREPSQSLDMLLTCAMPPAGDGMSQAVRRDHLPLIQTWILQASRVDVAMDKCGVCFYSSACTVQ